LWRINGEIYRKKERWMVSVGRHGRVKSLFNHYGAKVREFEIEKGVVGI